MTTVIAHTINLKELSAATESLSKTEKWPVLFVGHGSPRNAIKDNTFTQSLTKLGYKLGKPNAILIISAHWQTEGTYVSINPKPPVIYDFGGFEDTLYQVKYPAHGQPELAKETATLIKSTKVIHDEEMGLDHGAWTILKFLYPLADVPVFEMSMDYRKSPQIHFNLGQQLQALRKKGVLIIGSGNVVHNLRKADFYNENSQAPDWAIDFDQNLKKQINNRSFQSVINYQSIGSSASLSVPTNEHYLPLLYILGLSDSNDQIEHVIEGFQHGTISMRCILFS